MGVITGIVSELGAFFWSLCCGILLIALLLVVLGFLFGIQFADPHFVRSATAFLNFR